MVGHSSERAVGKWRWGIVARESTQGSRSGYGSCLPRIDSSSIAQRMDVCWARDVNIQDRRLNMEPWRPPCAMPKSRFRKERPTCEGDGERADSSEDSCVVFVSWRWKEVLQLIDLPNCFHLDLGFMQSLFRCDFGVNPQALAVLHYWVTPGQQNLHSDVLPFSLFFPVHPSLTNLCLNLEGGVGRVQCKPLLLTEKAAVHWVHTVTWVGVLLNTPQENAHPESLQLWI